MALIPDFEAQRPAADPVNPRDAEVMQRLRVGIGGIVTVLLVVGLANVITDRVLRTEETTVPQAAPTVEPSAATPASDPLSDAGVVPDLPEQPEAEPIPEGPVLPEQGEGAPVE
ncbi:hypothetical protein AAG614_01075 [Citromicrobium bathyomarinum]|jgi:hypothetical protein|uniref:hypothetical protein n=1 Tax=Citromicrobium TaxID=72173 RepID=UPI0001DD1133|nr:MULTISPECIES: hypothetical protein [Citromicrobium]MAO04931.1 hypothetical protein [Citromicrobium sp.]ALG60703.1 hypothetical protein WG74_07565 [Citromicrobium sp. JL477]KPM14643.1 hypothetical protein VO58_10740 [Citromicrobium sp. JL1351]KPM15788.1 hypothetical protein WG75_06940 [Citromicrobium sp. WPS32]KPM19943.1 hypothetical protein VM77_05755 [Citromicrobium sp. JL31]|tara:strand:+ start:932 stop:1273 length:342 start_codon:yes stop_codon:yes gene_type:complete